MASPPSPVPTSSPSPPSQGDMIPPPSSDPEPPISKSSTPTDPPAASPPQSISAPPPFPSSSPPVSPPDVENPSSPPLSQSPPHSPPIAPASSVVPPPALAALLPPPSNPVEPPPMQPPPSPIPSDPPPVQPPPSSIIQTTPPSPSLPVSSPRPPPRLSHSTPSKSPGGSSPPSVEKSSPPPAHRKPTPPPSTLVPPTASGHQTPPPSSSQKPHLPTKLSPQPSFEPSSNSSAHKLVLPPSPSVKPPPAVPPSNFSISPLAPHPIPPDPLAPELFSSPRAQPGTPLDSLKPAATFPPNIAEEVASNRKQSRIKPGEAAGISVPIAFIILLVVSVAWFMRRKKNKEVNRGGYIMPTSLASSNASESNFPRSQTTPLVKASYGSNAYLHAPSEGVLGYSKSWFTFEELSDVTNGFSPHNILGKGGFGTVYKGRLSDGREVAVKQLKVGGGQGEREFQAEVEIISRIHHRHLVSLVGHCISENQRLLVYDFVPNNTLFYHLHGSGRPVLEWSMRIKVAAGSARGLAYLHEDCHPRIIHRDIKSSNILLDNNFEARVSDFGLAKLTVDAETHVSTRVMGTFGYMAPEYASSGKLTDKSDVYSFGVVLLELITGRKPVDPSQPLGDENLVEWARPLMTQVLETGDLGELPDPRLEKNYNSTDMFQMVEAAAACVRHSASMRPRMGLVKRALDNLAEVGDLHNGVKPGESELFHSIANSEEIRLFQRMAFGSQEYSNDVSRSSQLSQSHIDV